MNIPIIASTISGIAEALTRMGYDLMGDIAWNQMPMKIDGVWRMACGDTPWMSANRRSPSRISHGRPAQSS